MKPVGSTLLGFSHTLPKPVRSSRFLIWLSHDLAEGREERSTYAFSAGVIYPS